MPKPKHSSRPKPEWVKRSFDNKLVKWEWKYDTELNIIPWNLAKRFDYLKEKGRWVVTQIKDYHD